jgi:hypothetical protein
MGGAATVTGAYDPNASGSNAYSTTIYPFPTLACGTGAQSHVGSFRVIARVQSTTADSQVRLLWANTIGGEVSATRYTQIPAASRWHELELGVIHVPAVISGTQVWGGFIQAQTGDTVTSATLTVDYLLLVPVTDGSGVARTGANVPDGTMSGYDSFTATTAGVALNARVSPTGPTWATSGAAGDFTFSDALDGEQLTRNTNDASRRLALFGTGTFGDVDTSVRFYIPSGSISNVHVVHARYVDANNYLETELQSGAFEDHDTMVIIAVVGGATVAYASTDISSLASGWYKLRLLAWQGTGHGLALLSTDSGSLRATVELSDASLKAAGTLATGKVGFADIGNAAVARYYDDFYVGVPLTEPTVINSGRNIEIRHDDTIRQDSTGVYMSRPPSYRGSRFLVPVGTSRVLVKARRNDVETSETPNVTDATQLQVGLTPRGLVVPR